MITALYHKGLRPLTLCVGILFYTQALALPDDTAQVLDIMAQDSEIDVQEKTTTFIGKVQLRQGSLKINADRLVYFGELGTGEGFNPDKIVATGTPAEFRVTPQVGDSEVVARANRLEYSVASRNLILTGAASLNQDGSSLSGNQIEYVLNLNLVKAVGESSKDGERDGRVRLVIPPRRLKKN
jgi:lipopolysaccharide export system protein LptA